MTDVKAPLAAHIESDFIIDKPAACLTAGSKHTQCTVCTLVIKTETIPALGHNEITHAAKEATCVVTGNNAYVTCSRCNYSTYKEIPAKGHDKISHNGKAATCTQSGYAAYETCSRCNYSTYKTIPAKGHTEVIDAGIAPTRTKSGLTEGKHCSVCNLVLVAQQEIPATGYSDGLNYTVNSDGTTCAVTGIGTCADSEIVIPKTSPDGYTVTEIGEKAFADSTAISIFIPDTIKIIGTRAFYNCANITEIHIPSSVTKIGTQIFYKASNLNTVYYDSSYSNRENPFLNVANIKKIVFGGKSVPSNITYKCTNLTEIEILDGVISIDSYAFYGCSGLTSITIPDSVTSIDGYAFYGCSSLTSITIPDGVTSIDGYAFKKSSTLL